MAAVLPGPRVQCTPGGGRRGCGVAGVAGVAIGEEAAARSGVTGRRTAKGAGGTGAVNVGLGRWTAHEHHEQMSMMSTFDLRQLGRGGP